MLFCDFCISCRSAITSLSNPIKLYRYIFKYFIGLGIPQ